LSKWIISPWIDLIHFALLAQPAGILGTKLKLLRQRAFSMILSSFALAGDEKVVKIILEEYGTDRHGETDSK
jgi:hypothetical protein